MGLKNKLHYSTIRYLAELVNVKSLNMDSAICECGNDIMWSKNYESIEDEFIFRDHPAEWQVIQCNKCKKIYWVYYYNHEDTLEEIQDYYTQS